MNEITKVSDITAMDLADYIRLDEVTNEETTLLDNLLGVAKKYIINFTGTKDLDSNQDFVIVVFILVQDMWDNRTYYVDKNNINQTVDTILSLHAVNLL